MIHERTVYMIVIGLLLLLPLDWLRARLVSAAFSPNSTPLDNFILFIFLVCAYLAIPILLANRHP